MNNDVLIGWTSGIDLKGGDAFQKFTAKSIPARHPVGVNGIDYKQAEEADGLHQAGRWCSW